MFEDGPKNTRSSIFKDPRHATMFCIRMKLLEKTKPCHKCMYTMKLELDTAATTKYRYRCTNMDCKKSISLLKGRFIENPQVMLNEYLLAVYMWLEKDFNLNIINNCILSKSSFERIKRIILFLIKKENDKDVEKIGTLGNPVQVDETVICKGKHKKPPSNCKYEIKNTT